MVASTVNRRSRYGEYAQFLRLSADRLDMAVAPGRLENLRSKVNAERNTFRGWVIIWSVRRRLISRPRAMSCSAVFGSARRRPTRNSSRTGRC